MPVDLESTEKITCVSSAPCATHQLNTEAVYSIFHIAERKMKFLKCPDGGEMSHLNGQMFSK